MSLETTSAAPLMIAASSSSDVLPDRSIASARIVRPTSQVTSRSDAVPVSTIDAPAFASASATAAKFRAGHRRDATDAPGMDDDDRLVAARDESGRTDSGVVDRELERLVRDGPSDQAAQVEPAPDLRHRIIGGQKQPGVRTPVSGPAVRRHASRPEQADDRPADEPVPVHVDREVELALLDLAQEPRDRRQIGVELGQTGETREVDELVDIAVEALGEGPRRGQADESDPRVWDIRAHRPEGRDGAQEVAQPWQGPEDDDRSKAAVGHAAAR